MATNPDVYLLYEYRKKNAFTVRMKITLDEAVDEALLTQAASEAMTRFPYYSVKVDLDEGENYVLLPNDRQIKVLPEKDERLVLGSEEVAEHLFAITWRDNSIWFNWAHCMCGAYGAMYWIKTTLYQYLTKKYGPLTPPVDLKEVGSVVDEAEYACPDVKAFMDYAKKIDGSPNSVLAAIMMKTSARYFPQKDGWHISAKIADDYRKDSGCSKSYRDYVRFIHVKYDWDMEKESIERLSQRARGAIITQMQPENSFEWYRRLDEARKGIDEQPDLKSKKKYAQKHSIYKSDARDTYMVSYVGKTDWGGMADYIDSLYVITDGNMMLEVMAMPDKICVTFQLLSKNSKLLDMFCEVLDEEKIAYQVSERMVRNMPDIQLPEVN